MSTLNTEQGLSIPKIGDFVRIMRAHGANNGRCGKVVLSSLENASRFLVDLSYDAHEPEKEWCHCANLEVVEANFKAPLAQPRPEESGGSLPDEVEGIVREYVSTLKQRVAEYGSPEDSFAIIGQTWGALLSAKMGQKVELSASEVSMMLEVFKMCRIWSGINKDDSFGDKTMYSAMSHVLMRREKK